MATRQMRVSVFLAAGLAFASALTTLYWTVGGTWLLDTVGGSFERLARERDVGALLLGAAVALVKVAAGCCALAMLAQLRRMRRLVFGINALAAGVLCLWGGANVFIGALVLVVGGADTDRHALLWHVFFWDAWFLIWGLALAGAVVIAAQERGNRHDVRR